MDASDQSCVSHIKLGQGFKASILHGKGVQHASVVSRPCFTAAVAHGYQVRVQLEMEGFTGVICPFEHTGTLIQNQETVCVYALAFTLSFFKPFPALRSYTATVQSLLPEMMYLSSAARHITALPWRWRLFTSGSAAVEQ